MSDPCEVLNRYRDFAGLPIEAWRAALDGDLEAARPAIAARPLNAYEAFLWEDLVATLRTPDAWEALDRNVLAALGAVDPANRGGASPLGQVAQWLGRELWKRGPAEESWADELLAAMRLSEADAIALLSFVPATRSPSSPARRLLELDDEALTALLRRQAALGVPSILVTIARGAPGRLPELLGAVFESHSAHKKVQFLTTVARELPHGALSGVLRGEIPSEAASVVETLAPELAVPFLDRFTSCGETLVRTRRLDAARWSAIEAHVSRASAAEPGLLARVDADVPALLTRTLPLAQRLDAASARLATALIAGRHLAHLAHWIDLGLRIEREGEDGFAHVHAALVAGGMSAEEIRAFVARHLRATRVDEVPTSLGRWILARGDEELRALAAAKLQPNAWGADVFLLVAAAAPERLSPLFGVLREMRGWSALNAIPTVLSTLILTPDGAKDAAALLRVIVADPIARLLPGEREQPGAADQAKSSAISAGRTLASCDPAALPEARALALDLARDPTSQQGHESVRWLIRTFGSDVGDELGTILLERIEARATAPTTATIASHLLAAFGSRCAPAVTWHLENPHAYLRLTAIQRVLNRRPEEADPRVLAALESLFADSQPSMVTQSLNWASAWSWDWTEPRCWNLLTNKSGRIRMAAVAQIAAHRTDASWARAVPILAGKQAPARLGAIALLSTLDAETASPLLEARLDVEGSEEVRDALLLALEETWAKTGRKATWTDVEKRVAKAGSSRALAPWLDVATLPKLRLTDGELVSDKAVAWLLARQARVKGVRPDLDAAMLYGLVDRSTSGDLASHLLEGFLRGGSLAEEGFVLTVVGKLGDERVVAPLTRAVHEWVKDKRGVFAEYGVQALALLDSDAALRAVDDIALRYLQKPKGLNDVATEAFADAAERRGLTVDELRERVVPWLGFPEDGGPRLVDAGGGARLEVGIDDELNVTLRDPVKRKLVKSLPKSAPAELQSEIKQLRALVKEAAKIQAARLENQMVSGTRWPMERFTQHVTRHPLLAPFARRLVWIAGSTSFRADASGSPVGADGKPVTVPDDAVVAIAHPLQLGDAERAAWAAALPSQPFNQLGRAVTRVTPEEMGEQEWFGVEGSEASTRAIKGQAARLGWRRGDTSGGYIQTFWKSFLGGELVAHLSMEDMPVALDMSRSATVHELYFIRPGAGRLALGDVDPIAFSEAVAGAYALAGKPPPA